MKKLLLSGLVSTISFGLMAQCVTITCPSSIVASTDPNSCTAVVNYTLPTYGSTCTITAADTFQYTGAQQIYVVPPGVTSVTIRTWGAQGGANWVNNVNYGGYAVATFAVTPGETLYVYVGQQPTSITGGFNGGGNGEGAGKGGGGATDVRQGGNALTNRILVAGGGGGAGYWSSLHVVGGVGGGLTGGNGYRDPDYATNPGGQGGTQTGSGVGTCVSFNNPSVAGGFGYGGAPSGCGCEGYGGGGGWYGGAGSGNCRGGGGGSGYILSSATGGSFQSGVRAGNGMAIISYNTTTTAVLTQTAGLASGSQFPIGVTTNTFLADDGNGNSQSCSFTVTVNDNELPVFGSCPADTVMCPGVFTFSTPGATDNCQLTGVGQTSGPQSGDNLIAGTYTVTFTASDNSGNSATCDFTITVNALPVVTYAEQTTSMCVNWPVQTLTAATPPGGVYSGVAVSGNQFDPAAAGAGTFDVVYTYTDPNGCTNSDTSQITVGLCTGLDAPVEGWFSLYPNPAKQNVTVRAPLGATFELFNAMGQEVMEVKIETQETEIGLGALPVGIYTVRVGNGHSVFVKKLVIE
jgi:hypothetical protein